MYKLLEEFKTSEETHQLVFTDLDKYTGYKNLIFTFYVRGTLPMLADAFININGQYGKVYDHELVNPPLQHRDTRFVLPRIIGYEDYNTTILLSALDYADDGVKKFYINAIWKEVGLWGRLTYMVSEPLRTLNLGINNGSFIVGSKGFVYGNY